MLKCKNCGEVFPGFYLSEDTKKGSKLKANSISSHMCSRGHKNDYLPDDFMDWSGPETF
jgi:hypothetical protein